MTLPNQTNKPHEAAGSSAAAQPLDGPPMERTPVDSPPVEEWDLYPTAEEARAARLAKRPPAPPRPTDDEDIPF